jgi:hypothetical protein
VQVYRANSKICNACPVKAKCTDSKSGRYIFRSFFQEDLDRAEAYQKTEAYQKAIRKRSVWVERLFGEAKQFHRLGRFRLRGLEKVNIEGIMVAAGQNIKRLIKRASTGPFSLSEWLCLLVHSPTPLTFQQAASFNDDRAPGHHPCRDKEPGVCVRTPLFYAPLARNFPCNLPTSAPPCPGF